MSRPVEEQLRAYFGAVDVAQRPVTLDEIATVDRDVVVPMRPTGPRGATRALLLTAAVVLVVVGLALLARADEPLEPVGPPNVTVVPPVGGDPLPSRAPIESGRWTFDELGMPLSFSFEPGRLGLPRDLADPPVELEWNVVSRRPGDVVIAAFRAPGQNRGFRFKRLGGWRGIDEAASAVVQNVGSIDPYDVDTWIAEGYVQAEVRPPTTIAGRDARSWDFRIDPTSAIDAGCTDGQEPCAFLNTVAAPSFDLSRQNDVWGLAFDGVRNRMWLVPVEGDDPILIEAFTTVDPTLSSDAVDADRSWFDQFESVILPTIRIGPDGPPAPCDGSTCLAQRSSPVSRG